MHARDFRGNSRHQVAGIELAEFEASQDDLKDASAIECLPDIVGQLLGTRQPA
ncbi:hypothetical protein N183_09770 [Sinorhizobium sp. Sb3]|jgi:hypothetical protein|nr:hypothetical protein N183_09770 [Sinorhizobium sp. Sb3]